MRLPEYVTPGEVKRVCGELGIRDWTRLKKPKVARDEAARILRHLDCRGLKVDVEQFRAGLEVELEHGTMFRKYNVTNNHPLLTGCIVLAHFMESLDYYRRLEVMELEGDLFKAVASKNMARARKYAKRTAAARAALAAFEAKRL